MATHHRDAVAILQAQVVAGQELDVAAQHTTHVDTIGVAQLQLAQVTAVEGGARHDADTALHVGVDGIPVDLLAVPVFLHLLAEEQHHGVFILLGSHHEQRVALQDDGGRHGHDDLSVAPDAGDDKLQVGELGYLRDGLAGNGRVHRDELCDVGVVVVSEGLHLKVAGLDEALADEHHGDDDAHHTERIGDSRGQGHTVRRQAQHIQRLRGRAKGRRVGGGATEQAHHVGQADTRDGHQGKGKQGARDDDGQAPQVERHALMAERPEDVGAHVEAETIDKHREAEGLGIVEHRGVDGQPQVAGQDADEEDESHAQRDSHHLDLAQGHAYGNDQRNDNHRLGGRVDGEERV